MERWRVTVRERTERGKILMHNTADNRIGVVDLLFNWMRGEPRHPKISVVMESFDV